MPSIYDVYQFYLKPEDLGAQSHTVTVGSVAVEEVFNPRIKRNEQRVVIGFAGWLLPFAACQKKVMPLNKTQATALIGAAQTDDYNRWLGVRVVLTSGPAGNNKRTIVITRAPAPGKPALIGAEGQAPTTPLVTSTAEAGQGDVPGVPQPPRTTTLAPISETNGHTRPYAPEVLRAGIARKIEKHAQAGTVAGNGKRGIVVVALESVFAGGDPATAENKHWPQACRQRVMAYLTGYEKMSEASDPAVLALYEWLKPFRDSGGQWLPDAVAAQEARAVLSVLENGDGAQ